MACRFSSEEDYGAIRFPTITRPRFPGDAHRQACVSFLADLILTSTVLPATRAVFISVSG